MPKRKSVKNDIDGGRAEFRRQELKFVISNNLVDILEPEFLRFLDYDKYSQAGFYDIFSVYFDTHDWQAFYAKMDGNLRRRKFRIRSYYPYPKPDEKVFLEIKEKSDYTVKKRRVPINMQDITRLMDGEPPVVNTPVLNDWRYSILRDRIKPKLLNFYHRRAFVSEHFPGLRITIDRDVSYKMTDTVDFTLPTRWTTWAYDKSVVEVKFDQYMPTPVANILRRYNLTKEPVSKYCDSVTSNFLLL